MKRVPLRFAIVIAVVLGSGCEADDEASSLVDARVTEVQITKQGIVPAQVKIYVGDVVSWTWSDGPHNIVFGTNCTPDGRYSSGPAQPSGSVERKFDTVGTFPYFSEPDCSNGVTGEVIVEP